MSAELTTATMTSPPDTTPPLAVDIAIVGGNLVGASLALALAGRWRVALLERQPPQAAPDTAVLDPRVYAISPGSRAFLESIGGWPADANRICPVWSMQIFGDTGGRLQFEAADIAAEELACIAESSVLQWALWQALPDTLTRLPATRPTALETGHDGLTLHLDDGRRLYTRLLVGADGPQSWVRQAAGLGFTRQPYDQRGVVAHFATARPHRGIARQWFSAAGVLAWLPLPGQRVSIVWSCSEVLAQELLALPAAQLAQRVEAAGHATLGPMTLLAPPAAFPLAKSRAGQMAGPRVVLVGDAAHTVHPLAGQGVNLGFADARTLAALLTPPTVRDPGSAHLLSAFARQRAGDVLAVQASCDALHHLFSARQPLWAGLRNAGLNLADTLSPLKAALMRQAMR
jgi:2-octaprenyl-6-methoxyphenol hydroxylase